MNYFISDYSLGAHPKILLAPMVTNWNTSEEELELIINAL